MISFTVAIASFLVVQTKAGFYQKHSAKAKEGEKGSGSVSFKRGGTDFMTQK
jgi:hypothetical protein